MISVSEVITDPDFAQQFYVYRSTGTFARGGFTDTKAIMSFYGVIEVATPTELQLLPQGERVSGAISVYTLEQIIIANNFGDFGEQTFGRLGFGSYSNNESDIIEWRNQQYKAITQYRWGDFGYYKVIATRMSAE